jgi:hypothetical protein
MEYGFLTPPPKKQSKKNIKANNANANAANDSSKAATTSASSAKSPFSSSSSSSSLSSPSKNANGRLQSKIKTIVISFGKLLLYWRHDCEQVALLLSALRDLIATKLSVASAADRWASDPFFRNHPNLASRIVANVLLDAEAIFFQIRMFQGRLRDLHTAMKLSAADAVKVLHSEDLDAFPADSASVVFNAEHLLDIQSIRFQFTREQQRKGLLLSAVLQNNKKQKANENDYENDDYDEGEDMAKADDETYSTFYQSSIDAIDQCIAAWPDTCSASCVSSEEVDVFLLKNGIES